MAIARRERRRALRRPRRWPIDNLIGVYEKSLPQHRPWPDVFDQASRAGYDYIELSIDESARRMARLDWSTSQRQLVRAAAHAKGLRIGAIALSAHRAVPLGSADPGVRDHASELLEKAIRLAADLGATCVQIPGYFTYYDPPSPQARQRFVEGLRLGADEAERHGILLGLENVDGRDVLTAEDGLKVVSEVGSTSVGVYVDVGNYVANNLDVCSELRAALPSAIAIQLKDALPGVFRRVPFGAGQVPFVDVFQVLRDASYRGPLSVEMWNDGGDQTLAANAHSWLAEQVGSTPTTAGT